MFCYHSCCFSENLIERKPDNDITEEQEEDIDEDASNTPSAYSESDWVEPDDDELIVIETGDGAPLVGTVETAESYYVVNPHQHSFHGLSSGIIYFIVHCIVCCLSYNKSFLIKLKSYNYICWIVHITHIVI